MSNKKLYLVLQPIKAGPNIQYSGSIELDEATGDDLVASGHLAQADADSIEADRLAQEGAAAELAAQESATAAAAEAQRLAEEAAAHAASGEAARVAAELELVGSLEGSSVWKDIVPLGKKANVPFQQVLLQAFQASGFTVDQWNDQADADRETKIADQVEKLRQALKGQK